MEDPNSALEQFRQQWKEEVTARSKQSQVSKSKAKPTHREGLSGSSNTIRRPVPPRSSTQFRTGDEDEDHSSYSDDMNLTSKLAGVQLRHDDDDEFSHKTAVKEPQSALEHYERAVEKETQGNLGDSLSHYRKAYRLDARVDQIYRNKHFPPTTKPVNPNPSNAAPTIPSTTHHSLHGPVDKVAFAELIASCATKSIYGSPPLIEGDTPPSCPIRLLPSEVLLEVLLRAAILDPASFVRLSLVCKRLAYHVYTENQIWKRVALGPEFGLKSQHYEFSSDLQGRPSIYTLLEEQPKFSLMQDESNRNWRDVFHNHPRIRYTGVYISTVNYTRPGGASASQFTWNSPVHIVTYYRYLRFFRDGSVISLLTTSEPIDVVHHLTRENMQSVSSGKDHPLNMTSAPALGAPAPAAVTGAASAIKQALRGRWRLSHPSADLSLPNIASSGMGLEDDLHIETEGVDPKYIYMMHLSLRSTTNRSSHGVKNNKLQWQSFWSYNKLTDDWAEFGLRNDRPFLFSRVKSYGLGY